jgi:hypothetical protein
MLSKILALAASSLLSLGLAGFLPPPDRGDGPLPHAKKKGERPGPEEDLRKAYGLLHRLRAKGRSADRPEARIRDWTERAVQFYRDGIKAYEQGDQRLAHEYGAIAHDLARAVDHAHNAMLFDRADDDLPAPPAGPDLEEIPGPLPKDLRKVYDRLGDDVDVPGSRFYRDAARDLYNAAKRAAEEGRHERAGELARAAEAMTHVIDHLGHAADKSPWPEPPRPEPKARPKAKAEFDRPEPKKERFDDLLPPSL